MKTKTQNFLAIGFAITWMILFALSGHIHGYHHETWKHALLAFITTFSGFCGLIVVGSLVSLIAFKGKNCKKLLNWIGWGFFFGACAGYLAWQVWRILQ